MSVREIDKTELRIRPVLKMALTFTIYSVSIEATTKLHYFITFLFLVYLFWDFDTK